MLLSIITPTYNRAYTLPELYQSLCRQTCSDFEWIVVDDGSTDNTEELVLNWQKETLNFPILFFKQENGGKHRAVNKAVSLASGEFSFIVDSDDYLTDDAVEVVNGWIIDCRGIDHLGGVAGVKASINTRKNVGCFPKYIKEDGFIDAKNNERRKKHLLGDKAEVYRTNLLKKNPFKTFEGENFISEDSCWNEFAYQGYFVRWYNRIIYLCEYLEDGLTKNGIAKEVNNFEGFTYCIQQRIKVGSWLYGMISRGYYYSVAKQKGLSVVQAAEKLGTTPFLIRIGIVLRSIKNLIKGQK